MEKLFNKLITETAREKLNKPNVNRIILPRKATKLDTPPKLSQENQSDIKDKSGIYESRRYAINYLCKIYGGPAKKEWKELNIVEITLETLIIPLNS